MNKVEIIARAVSGFSKEDFDACRFGTYMPNRIESSRVIAALVERGYAIVPVEPTEAMLDDGVDMWAMTEQTPVKIAVKHICKAMIQAALQEGSDGNDE